MNAVQIIGRKRDGAELAAGEIRFMVESFTGGELPDYQMSAWAMAIYLRGMSPDETTCLTRCMLESGETMRWPSGAAVVDKHSTGGVGDKVSLVLAPLLACCHLRVPMISGRGLGATGGTLDKLESIPGFRTDLGVDEIQAIVADHGCVITGASSEIAPADGKLYALRDVTATIGSIPLITASIMSKKLAEGLDALVLDVKVGDGAFMKTRERAEQLARSMVNVGGRMGVRVTALLTDMNQPLGRMIGNALEVEEALDCLRGSGPEDLRRLVLELGADLLQGDRGADIASCRRELAELLDNGQARSRFCDMVRAQGGDPEAARSLAAKHEVIAETSGVITRIANESLGWLLIDLGGGRRVLGDAIDHGVGIEINARLGQRVERGDPLAFVYCSDEQFVAAERAVREAMTLGEQAAEPLQLIIDRIG